MDLKNQTQKREIKFRAAIANVTPLTFVHGSYVQYAKKHCILREGREMVSVKPETVGQFTGLKDKNNRAIYEGDLLKIPETYENIGGIHKVYFYSDGWVTSSILFSDDKSANKYCLQWRIIKGAEVIGNIYEHPELLK